MSFFELLLIAVGLSMDAFAVALSDGTALRDRRRALLIAALFGFFQALMPLLGYFVCAGFAELICAYDHFVALAALGFIGGKMIAESVSELRCKNAASEQAVCSLSLPALIAQAVATSIDALVVGASFAVSGEEIFRSAAVIGATTFALSLVGALGGRKFGTLLGSKATLGGGIVLVLLGVKTVVEHLFF